MERRPERKGACGGCEQEGEDCGQNKQEGNTERRNRVTRKPLEGGTILEGPDLRNILKSRSTYHETGQLAP